MKLLAALIAALLGTAPALADPLADAVHADMPSLLTIYRDLHAHPELSFAEVRSSAILAREAKAAGWDVTAGVGRTGIVAVLRNGPGAVLLLRADMDALPVTEHTGLSFASTVVARARNGSDTGVAHACGHDTHMATWIGTARRLAALRSGWSGTIVMIAQPAEETGEGAKAMLDDGLFTRFPKPGFAIAFHDSAQLPVGTIGYAPGYTTANVDSVDLTIKGVGGHGAYPHLAKDPIVLAARIVTALQTLVSREVDPLDSGVVTVGSFNAGTRYNIIPDEAKLQLTVRSYTPEVRRILLDGIARIAKGEAIAAGMPDGRMPMMTLGEGFTPAGLNTEPLTAQIAAAFAARFGPDRVRVVRASMVGEDFSRYHLADPTIQSLLFWVGGVPQAGWDAARGDITLLPTLHSPLWAPDAERVIETATEAMTAAALTVLATR